MSRRWTAARKAALVRDFSAGVISEQEALQQHAMSPEELRSLLGRYRSRGEEGLKNKHVQERRV